jgi:3-(3-hydroxy-phenyl)propionate hydroxylase
MEADYDVAVVGYGPTGLVAASALGARGHRVIVVERWPGLYGMPRLTHIDGETARIIQNVGDVDRALRVARAVDSYQWKGADDEDLLTVDWSGRSSGYPAHFSIFQPDIEDAIDERVRTHPNVEVRQGWELDSLEQGDGLVSLRIRRWSKDRTQQWADGDGEHAFTAHYVIGADGAGSFVRSALGVERDDLHSDDVWLNIDTKALRPLPERFEQSSQFCDPVRPHMFMPIGVGRQRFEVAVLPGEDIEAAKKPEAAWRWLREKHDLGPDDVEILRNIVYVFSARTAETWRVGNVFLAGDAAHTMPPYMGQGACSGMRDAITLAWKLDLVLSGKAGDALLDSYEPERRPHASAIQQISVVLGQIANTLDVEQAASRDAAFRSGNAPTPPPFPTIVAGVIATDEAGSPRGPAGQLAPQGRVRHQGREGLFDDVFGGGFALITDADPELVLDPGQRAFLADIGAVVATVLPGTPFSFEELDDGYSSFFTEHGVGALLSRPDFHLFGVAAADGIGALVDELRDKLSYVPTSLEVASA